MKKIFTTALILILTGILSIYAQDRIYTPELISPEDNAFAQTPDVVIDWTAVTGGNTGIIMYELNMDTDPGFPSPMVFETEFVSGYQMDQLDFGETYYWKVRASDGDYVSEWSETRQFTVLRRVVTTKPLEAADEQKPNLDLEWTSISGILEYDYQFDTIGPWSRADVPVSGTLFSGAIADESHGWMVGEDGVVLFYDGTSVTEQTSNTSNDLMGVYFLDGSNGWAVGKSGTIIYFDGTEWMEQESNTSDDLEAVWFVDATNGWAVGEDGIILHYDGTSWTEDSFSAGKDLFDVTFVDANHGFAVGKSGTACIYDGSAWSSIESATPRDIYCCAFLDASTGYAGGKSGILLKYEDGMWDVYGNSLTNKDINGMSISGTAGWAVGKTGTVLEFDGFEWFLSSAGSQTTLRGAALNGDFGFALGEDGFAALLSNAAFSSPMAEVIYHVPGTESSVEVKDLLFGTTYYWRMRTKHSQDISEWSGARSLETMFTVELDKPNNNSTDQDLDVELKWDKVVDNITYEIQIDDDMNFGSPIPLETEDLAINAELLTFGIEYYWRVRAVHAHDASDWPEPFKFTTACCVTLTSPGNNETDVKIAPIVSWEAIGGIGGYQIQLDQTGDFTNLLVDELVGDGGQNSLALPILLEKNTQYYWRARAYRSIDSSNWSDVWSFTTVGELGIDEPGDIPGVTLYPNPANNTLYIQMNEKTDATLRLMVSDLLGKPVLEEEFDYVEYNKAQSIDVSRLSKGIYMIRLTNGNKVMTRKLIITR
jgi:photosystem II stability/assembly factor-like uncharacterized protein